MSNATLETPPVQTARHSPAPSARAAVEALLKNGELETAVTQLRALAFAAAPQIGDVIRLAEIYINVGLMQLAVPILDIVRSVEPHNAELPKQVARLKNPALFRTEWQLRPDNGGLVTRQDVENFFAQHYDITDWYFGAHYNRLVETLMRTAAYMTADANVLEVGSNGSFPLLLWKLFGIQNISASDGLGGFMGYDGKQIVRGEMHGLQFSLPIAKANLELERWPFEDESQDAVLCYETLEHFRQDPMFFMIEANRVLKSGGRLILTTPNSSSLKAIANILAQWSPYLYSVYCRGRDWPGMAHIKEYSVRELQLLFQKAGFAVDSHQTFSPYKDDVDDRVPGIKEAAIKFGLQEPLSGSTHFIVGRKTGLPTCRAYEPLYQADEPWAGWTQPSIS